MWVSVYSLDHGSERYQERELNNQDPSPLLEINKLFIDIFLNVFLGRFYAFICKSTAERSTEERDEDDTEQRSSWKYEPAL